MQWPKPQPPSHRQTQSVSLEIQDLLATHNKTNMLIFIGWFWAGHSRWANTGLCGLAVLERISDEWKVWKNSSLSILISICYPTSGIRAAQARPKSLLSPDWEWKKVGERRWKKKSIMSVSFFPSWAIPPAFHSFHFLSFHHAGWWHHDWWLTDNLSCDVI